METTINEIQTQNTEQGTELKNSVEPDSRAEGQSQTAEPETRAEIENALISILKQRPTRWNIRNKSQEFKELLLKLWERHGVEISRSYLRNLLNTNFKQAEYFKYEMRVFNILKYSFSSIEKRESYIYNKKMIFDNCNGERRIIVRSRKIVYLIPKKEGLKGGLN